MISDEEIFNRYVYLRIVEDSKIALSDFKSTASASLHYLSEVSGVKLIKANEGHWVKDDNKTQPEMYWVENITSLELEERRKNNIENITQDLSPSLALRIKQFESYTKDFHDFKKRNTQQATDLFEKALELLPENSDNKEVALAKAALQERINTNKEALEPYVDPYYETIREVYREPDLLKKINLLKSLYYGDIDKHAVEDMQKFLANHKPVSVNRFRTELRRDIAKQIQSCFHHYGERGSDIMFWQQEIDAHNNVLRGYKTKLLGPNGAFGKGGIYGPDSQILWSKQFKEPQKTKKKPYVAPMTWIEGEQLLLF